MKRRRYSAGGAVSLMLCFAVAALWMRSLWARDMFFLNTPKHYAYIEATNGLVVLEVYYPVDEKPGFWKVEFASYQPIDYDWGVAGFQWLSYEGTGDSGRGITFPLWLLAILLATTRGLPAP